MNLDQDGQSALFKLSEIDNELTRLKFEISKVSESAELLALQTELSSSSEGLIEARTKFENLDSQVARIEDDIRLVDERLNRDKERLNQTSSSKDAMGIQHEIDGLTNRKTTLEEMEYGLLGELEEAEKDLQKITENREQLNSKILAIQDEIQSRVEKLKLEGRKLSADRLIVAAKVSEEILSRYEKLSARQPAVGKIIDRACSACHMTLTVGAIDQLTSLAEDELGSCPECQAMIVK
ncbi:MAG: hypothetical protein EBU06_02060 [Micrococcales bacterium]|nr:hypothetical protein [Micrococcales bacterium]NBT46909.1 hypothetical protein [Actinomycetota bacterium]NBY43789.1 hypothetical protein [Micrococcales bacterium]